MKTPEELQRAYIAHQQEQDVLRTLRRKAFLKRWIWVSAATGLVASFPNYLTITWLAIPHALLCAGCGYLIVIFKRGHLSSMALVGLVNLILSLLFGHFNPFGLLGFSLAGAFIGVGVTIERDLA